MVRLTLRREPSELMSRAAPLADEARDLFSPSDPAMEPTPEATDERDTAFEGQPHSEKQLKNLC